LLIDLHLNTVFRKQDNAINPAKKAIRWTGKPIELVELVYALHETKSFNDGNVFLKDLFEIFCKMFDVEIKDFSRSFIDIKNRTDEKRTVFLDKLKKAFLQKLFRSDMR
jgi:hypothetical protein